MVWQRFMGLVSSTLLILVSKAYLWRQTRCLLAASLPATFSTTRHKPWHVPSTWWSRIVLACYNSSYEHCTASLPALSRGQRQPLVLQLLHPAILQNSARLALHQYCHIKAEVHNHLYSQNTTCLQCKVNTYKTTDFFKVDNNLDSFITLKQ